MARRTPTQLEQAANQHVANRIRTRRHHLGISQEALAHTAGVHRTFIGRIERGQINMTLGTIALIAKALNTTITDLIDGL